MFALKIRLLPLTIIVAVLVLATHVSDLLRGLPPGYSLPPHAAQAAEGTEAELAVIPAESEKGEIEQSVRYLDPNRTFSPSEMEILRNLSQRRQEIEDRAQELDMRAALLDAAEERFGEKLAELTSVRDEIQSLLEDYDKTREEQFQQLVSIYERMRAKDAAMIFNTMEIDVLISVFARMREARSAPILAEMNPERANEVTRKLVERRSWPEMDVLTE